MSEQIIKTINQIDKNNLLDVAEDTVNDLIPPGLKALRPQITQNIKSRLNLLNYKPNEILGLGILMEVFQYIK